ncbi:hypothetical protein BCR37DRAFT_389859 [Protomyces lactucae-debilis]|uniref:Arb2 domain-containing protein n=1 Tax=Protomyces lactucae-debilis TaxID=2754530 RepID=A0A1Y2ESQ8_PROLT|nr:uncharacterized protein BCR37DRAFT_389859 [Protomyces lactucae-debilis]ORY74600.1 hypothetical protein BCR37DRAFT_389859 [Protomyces lactucae-debilis]
MLRRKTAVKEDGPTWIFDPYKRYTLEDLGLRYDAVTDRITLLDNPEEPYKYKMKQSDEDYNDQLWFALSRLLDDMTQERMTKIGMRLLRLPLGAAETDKHTRIYVSEDFDKKQELTLVFPDGGEMGSWYGRLITDKTIANGSFEDFVKTFTKPERGIVIASPTVCVWNKELGRAITHRESMIASKKSPLGKIQGSETQQAHIEYVLDYVARPSAAEQINLVAVGYSAWAAIHYIHACWPTWRDRLTAIACFCTNHSVNEFTLPDFLDFLSANCINFAASDKPLKTIVEDRRFGCMTQAWNSSKRFSKAEQWNTRK